MLCQLSICNILLTKNMYFEYITINFLPLFIYREIKFVYLYKKQGVMLLIKDTLLDTHENPFCGISFG